MSDLLGVAADVVAVEGADARSYLSGQLSNDVQSLQPGDVTWALLLKPQGHLIALLTVHCEADDRFLLVVDRSTTEAVLARLRRFLLRTKATIEVQPSIGVAHRDAEGDEPGLLYGGTSLGQRVLVPDAVVSHNHPVWEQKRIGASLPIIGVDLPNECIPAEGGQAMIDSAVSFTKGCYTGQELVARVDSRGNNAPFRLQLLEAAGPVEMGAAISSADGAVSEVSSVATLEGRSQILTRLPRKIQHGAPLHIDALELQWPTG